MADTIVVTEPLIQTVTVSSGAPSAAPLFFGEGTSGLVPDPGTGIDDRVLRADGTWGEQTGGGGGGAPTSAQYVVLDTDAGLTGERVLTGESGVIDIADGGAGAAVTLSLDAGGVKTKYESNTNTNAFTDAEQTKLAGIQALATDDQTAAEILTALLTVDGSASTLDADLLDGQEASEFAAASHAHIIGDTTGLQAALDAKVDDSQISAFGLTLVDDADAATARATLGVDEPGTDNSTDVTLAGTPDYLTIAGQVITRNAIDLAADVTGLLPVSGLNISGTPDGSKFLRDDASWQAIPGGGDLLAANNLSDLASDVTSRVNLGVEIGVDVQAYAAALDNVSGTNSGDQTISLTGEVTGSGTGSFAATIEANAVTTTKILNGAVTLAKMADIATNSILGRDTTGSGVPEVLDAATARSVIDVDQAGTDNSTDITLAGTLDYLTLSGQQITRGAIDLATDVTGVLPFSNVQTISTDRILGRDTTGTGDIEQLTGTQVTSLLDTFSLGTQGVVPGPSVTPVGLTFLRDDGTWATPSGSGDVSKVGTPLDNQVGVWTGDGTIEGDADLTFDGTNLTVGGTISASNVSGSNTGDQSAGSIEAIVSHDNLLDFLAAEHVDWAGASAGTIHSTNITGLVHGTQVDNPSSGVHGVSGSVVGTTDSQTLTTKVIAFGSNTVSGTMAEFDTAVTDGNIAYAGGAFHDGFSDYVAAEHVDWAGAGAGTIHTDNYIEGGAGTDTTAIHDNVAGEISATAVLEKVTPVSGDWLLIEDSADSDNKKKVQIGNLPAGSEANNLEADGAVGIALNEVPVGSGAGTVVYQTLPTAAITDAAVTYAKMQNVSATDRFLGRDTAGAGVVEEIDATAALAILGVEAGADVTDATNVAAAGAAMSGGAFHDGFSDFVANEHIDWTSAAVALDTTGTGAFTDILTVRGVSANAGRVRISEDLDNGTSYIELISPSALAANRVLTLPDPGGPDTLVSLTSSDTLTNKTLTTPTIGDLTNAAHDHADAAGGGQIVATTGLADFKANSILLNDSASTAAPQVADELDIATVAPAGADFILGWTSAGLLRKYTVTSLPAGSEANNLEADGAAGIALDEMFVGSGAGTGTYEATTGTGAPVRTTSPTIVTPTIASFTNATHTHTNAAGGGVLDLSAINPDAELDMGAHSVGFTLDEYTDDSSDEINLDMRAGNQKKLNLTAATITVDFANNPTNPGAYHLIVVQDGSGSRTISWPTTGNVILWAGGAEPTLSTAADSVDIISLIWDGTDYHGAAVLDFQVV